MLKMLLLVALLVIGVQSLIIALLVGLVNKTRKEKNAQKNQSRQFMKALIKITTEVQQELEEYKEAYHKCHKEFSVLFRENKILNEQLNQINKIHGEVVNNLMICIKEGRVIKSNYMGTLIPYKFENMTINEISQFFGTKAS